MGILDRCMILDLVLRLCLRMIDECEIQLGLVFTDDVDVGG
jgi:hypothetical protein